MPNVIILRKQNKTGREIAEHAMDIITGRSKARMYGKLIRWESEKKQCLCVGGDCISVHQLPQHLTEHEIDLITCCQMESHSQEGCMMAIVLLFITTAIKREKGIHIECQCQYCTFQRKNQEIHNLFGA